MSAHNQPNRVPKGVPTGGEFSESSRGEPQLSGFFAAADEPDWQRNPFAYGAEKTRPLLRQLRRESDDIQTKRTDVQNRIAELPADSIDYWNLDDDRERLDGELSHLSGRLRNATITHAMSMDGRVEVLDEMSSDDLDDDTKHRYGLLMSPTALENLAELSRMGYDRMAESGVGDNAKPIPAAEARRRMPVGTTVSRTYPTGGPRGETVTGLKIKSQSGYQQTVTDSEGHESVLGWQSNKVLEDSQGNLIVCDEDSRPFVVYRVEDNAGESD